MPIVDGCAGVAAAAGLGSTGSRKASGRRRRWAEPPWHMGNLWFWWMVNADWWLMVDDGWCWSMLVIDGYCWLTVDANDAAVYHGGRSLGGFRDAPEGVVKCCFFCSVRASTHAWAASSVSREKDYDMSWLQSTKTIEKNNRMMRMIPGTNTDDNRHVFAGVCQSYSWKIIM